MHFVKDSGGRYRQGVVVVAKRGHRLMKLLVIILAIIWFLCGLVGAWWLDDVHLKRVALGPITLVRAFNDQPVNYPGPN